MIRIKICGLSEPATLDAAASAGAHYVGFVFFPASPRNVTLDRVRALAARTPTQVGRVGVFVDPDEALLDAAIRAGRLDIIQLHGDESPERAADIRRRFGLEVWKGLGVSTRADIVAAKRYVQAADRLLFDAKAPSSANLPGGSGIRFDWRLLAGADVPMAWGLSGGLDASNVGEAIGATAARLVDVSSGVEVTPGVKSAEKIKAFIKAVRDL